MRIAAGAGRGRTSETSLDDSILMDIFWSMSSLHL